MSDLDATTGARLIVDALVAGLTELTKDPSKDHAADHAADLAADEPTDAGIGGPMRAPNRDHGAARALIDVVMAPGSRSTPLVAACARDARVRLTVVHDERSGAFLALGIARRSGKAAVLLTTSGTAVANAGPAVVEADCDRVPLLLLTADRPLEATGTDANQTIEQRHFFGPRARAFLDVPPPEDVRDIAALTMALDDVVAAAHGAPRGPVHINARFRKPLEPSSTPPPAAPTRRLRRHASRAALGSESLAALVAALRSARRGVIVAGSAADDDDSAGCAALARALAWPVLACATSGLRHPRHELRVIATTAVLVQAGCVLPDADVVVRLGGALVDDKLAQVCAAATQVVRVDERARRRLERAGPTQLFAARPGDVADAVLAAGWRGDMGGHSDVLARRGPWQPLVDDDACARAALQTGAPDALGGDCDEPAIARAVVDAALAHDTALFAGNSMPIRAIDRFCADAPRVLANRGASGIDGQLSTAAGIALSGGATLALLGDLTFLHDAGALSALAGVPALRLRVVVIDNGGGGIFDFLPIARHPDLLTRCFTTPHDVDLVALCRAYRVAAARVDDLATLRERLRRPVEHLEVIVVGVARAHSVARDRARVAAIAHALGRPGGAP